VLCESYRKLVRVEERGKHIMKNLIRLVIAEAIILVFAGCAFGQWIHSTSRDPFSGKTVEMYSLHGRYLEPPKSGAGDPVFTVACTNGKFGGAALATGAIFNSPLVETRVDEEKSFRLVGAEAQDFKSIMFIYKWNIKKILTGHKMVMGAFEFPNSTSIVMEFEIPDPAQIFATCGKL